MSSMVGTLRQRLGGGSTPPLSQPGSSRISVEDGQVGQSEGPKTISGELGRFFKDFTSAPDRGKSFYQQERQRYHLASLVEAGRHAGKSRVEYTGRNITYHLFTKDFFITVINQKTTTIMLTVAAVYLFIFLFFSIWWYLVVRFYPGCLYGATTYIEAFTFAVVTHMTIGYGNTGPQACWAAAWLIAVQIIIALLLESIVIGIVFARISHPKQRSRSIFISDSAIIARRDGILKFMFRVADIRRTQVVDPKIKAFMYTWGEGRITAEGERIPVRCEQLDLGYIDGMLLLPLIIEHTIDERSPLCGHTHDSLMALNAEVVVTFEGTTEFGNPFMARRSYLPTEVHWGHKFEEIIEKPPPGSDDARYIINLNKFHNVVPQEGLPLLTPSELSQLVVNRAKRTVPYPLLGENTLVLSDLLCVCPNERGQPCLMARTADTYPNQMLEITVRMYLYRWRQSSEQGKSTFTQYNLECGYESGEDRLYLRLPTEVYHVIDEDSPIRGWLKPGGLAADADSEVVVVINSYLHVTGQNRLRQRTYTVHNHVRYGFRFQNIVRHPAESRDRKPRVRWAHFHDILPADDLEECGLPPRGSLGLAPIPSQSNLAAVYARLPSLAPESHGALRSVETRQHMYSGVGDGGRGRASVQVLPAASGGRELGLPPRGPGAGRLGSQLAAPAYQPTPEEERNDYTVLPIDLSRYAATAGNEGDTVTLVPAPRRSPLPTEFARQLAEASQHQQDVDEGHSEPFVLFPEVAALNYALQTTDAGDSLPHAQALHPTLPGPDRFRVEENEERNDYTVSSLDLSRYMAQMAASQRDGLFGPRAQAAAAALAEQREQREQQQQQQQQQASSSIAALLSGPSRQDTPPASVAGGGAVTAAEAGSLEQQEQQGRQQQQQAAEEDSPPSDVMAAAEAETVASGSAAADASEPSSSVQLPAAAEEEDDEQRQHAEDVAAALQQRLSRTPSTWALAQPEGGEQDGEKAAEAGPIHFLKQESWQKERALKNLFDPPPPDGSPPPQADQQGEGADDAR